MTGWQSPIERIPSTSAAGLLPSPMIRQLSTIHGAAPPQSSSQMPWELAVPPHPLTLFLRIRIPVASPVILMLAPLTPTCPLMVVCSTIE